MSIFLKLGDIEGQCTQKGYENWTQLNSFNMGVSRKIPMTVGKASDREFSFPKIDEVTLTKIVDKSMPLLLAEACNGKSCGKAEIHFVNSSDSAYIKLELDNVIIGDYKIDGYANNQRPIENIVLNFTKFELTYVPHDESNRADNPIPMGYDLATAKLL